MKLPSLWSWGMSLVYFSLDLLYTNHTLLAILSIKYSIIKIKIVPSVFWILSVLGTGLIILRSLTYCYYTHVTTKKDKKIFPSVLKLGFKSRSDFKAHFFKKKSWWYVVSLHPHCNVWCIHLFNKHEVPTVKCWNTKLHRTEWPLQPLHKVRERKVK